MGDGLSQKLLVFDPMRNFNEFDVLVDQGYNTNWIVEGWNAEV